jgi:hypothetical protein
MADIQVPSLGPATFNATIVDNNGDPKTVLDAGQNFKIVCDWQLSQADASVLGGQFELATYAESIGPGPEQQLGQTVVVPVNGTQNYGPVDIDVPANTLPDNVPPGPQSGAYKLTTLLSHSNFGAVTDIGAVVEFPVVRIS